MESIEIVCVGFLIIIIGIAALFILTYLQTRPGGKFLTQISFPNHKIKGDIKMVSMRYNQKVSVELLPQDANGNPALVEPGTVQVSSSNEAACTIKRDTNNELLFEILGAGAGVAQVDFSADADLGNGVETITGFLGVETLPGQAVGFGFNISEPVDQ